MIRVDGNEGGRLSCGLRPDGKLVYSTLDLSPGYQIEIYGFDVATGAVTPGGLIGVPSGLDPFYVAERN